MAERQWVTQIDRFIDGIKTDIQENRLKNEELLKRIIAFQKEIHELLNEPSGEVSGKDIPPVDSSNTA